MSLDDLIAQATEIVTSASPLFAGKPPEVQGAALAELLAIWVAQHYPSGDEMMERVLAHHIGYVRQLVPPCIAELKERG
jgi:hypothetical protein